MTADAPDAAPVLEDTTRSEIEFTAALEVVAARAVSTPGARRIRNRQPGGDGDAIAAELEAVAELADLIARGDRFVPRALPELDEHLAALRVEGGVLEAPALMAMGAALEAMHEVAAELRRLTDEAPRLATLRTPLPPLDLAERFSRTFDPDGSVRDGASPELRKARRAVRNARERLVRHLDEHLHRLSDRSEGSVTVRGGRYVIPVRRDSRQIRGGIVHDESGSGTTLFVEPADAVPLGNALSAAEAAERRAVHRIFRDLTAALRDHQRELGAGYDMCVAVDDRYARARYAVDVGAVCPDIVPDVGALAIREGRHPLLLAEGVDVVAFDLVPGPDRKVIVISGPNTGGKTVFLKAVGLLAALAQSGVIPPVGPGTTLPVFGTIRSDIGDHQSIVASLSTFSGHLRQIGSILEVADDRSLVLIDELGSGTDPAEGAALAAAVLKLLARRRTVTLVSTHLGQLKELAGATDGIANASLAFDAERLEPTYRFRLGVPGRSYGLAVARSLDFPEAVLQEAEALRPEAERSIEALLADLERREQGLRVREAEAAETGERLKAEADGLARLRVELDEQQRALAERERRLEREGRADARRFLLDARKRVEQALGAAQAAADDASVREARRIVEEGVREEGDALRKLEEQARRQGWTVRRAGDRGRSAPETTPGSGPGSPTPGRVRRRAAASVAVDVTASAELDLRGLTGDEAEMEVLRGIDAAVVDGLSGLRIIHGKGTGVLRERVAQVLTRDTRVSGFHPAHPTQGGWGVTVAELSS